MKYKVKQTFTGENGQTYERGEVIEDTSERAFGDTEGYIDAGWLEPLEGENGAVVEGDEVEDTPQPPPAAKPTSSEGGGTPA